MLSRLAIVSLFALAVALAGCTHCDVHGGTSCYGEPDEPTAAQRAGIEPRSLAHRLHALERRYPAVDGLAVNRWGEIWFKTPAEVVRGVDVRGRALRDTGASRDDVDLSDLFPLRYVVPASVSRVLRRARRRGLREPFISADVTRDDAFGGMTLAVEIGTDHHVVLLEAPYDGSRICVKTDGSRTHRCPEWRRQPRGIPGA